VDSLRQALSSSFVKAHGSIRDLTKSAGCTCSVVAVNVLQRFAVSANVGDSQALLALSDEDDVVVLTGDHRLSNDAERACVEKRGAVVAQAANKQGTGGKGPLRGWPGGLMMSRALGDADCPWISPEPEIQVVHLPEGGGQIIIASDGVWDALDADEVVHILRSELNRQSAAKLMVAEAVKKRGLHDDTSAMVAYVGPRGHRPGRHCPTPKTKGVRNPLSKLRMRKKTPEDISAEFGLLHMPDVKLLGEERDGLDTSHHSTKAS